MKQRLIDATSIENKALKAGKVLFSVDEYGVFIAYQKKED